MIELEEFIKGSLLQIHSALKKTNQNLSSKYSKDEKKNIFLLKPGSELDKGSGIRFDLSITTKEVTEGKAKGKVKIFIFSSDLDGEYGKTNQSISKIGFTVHVAKWTGTYKENELVVEPPCPDEHNKR